VTPSLRVYFLPVAHSIGGALRISWGKQTLKKSKFWNYPQRTAPIRHGYFLQGVAGNIRKFSICGISFKIFNRRENFNFFKRREKFQKKTNRRENFQNLSVAHHPIHALRVCFPKNPSTTPSPRGPSFSLAKNKTK
jgi:hypothetical protein